MNRLNSGISRILTPGNEIAQIVELQKSFGMILNSDLFLENGTSKIQFLTFAWAFG